MIFFCKIDITDPVCAHKRYIQCYSLVQIIRTSIAVCKIWFIYISKKRYTLFISYEIERICLDLTLKIYIKMIF